jgi:hypothetical protein
MTNACKDVWLVAIKVLQDGKNKSQKATKKKEENKNDLVCGNTLDAKWNVGKT